MPRWGRPRSTEMPGAGDEGMQRARAGMSDHRVGVVLEDSCGLYLHQAVVEGRPAAHVGGARGDDRVGVGRLRTVWATTEGCTHAGAHVGRDHRTRDEVTAVVAGCAGACPPRRRAATASSGWISSFGPPSSARKRAWLAKVELRKLRAGGVISERIARAQRQLLGTDSAGGCQAKVLVDAVRERGGKNSHCPRACGNPSPSAKGAHTRGPQSRRQPCAHRPSARPATRGSSAQKAAAAIASSLS